MNVTRDFLQLLGLVTLLTTCSNTFPRTLHWMSKTQYSKKIDSESRGFSVIHFRESQFAPLILGIGLLRFLAFHLSLIVLVMSTEDDLLNNFFAEINSLPAPSATTPAPSDEVYCCDCSWLPRNRLSHQTSSLSIQNVLFAWFFYYSDC